MSNRTLVSFPLSFPKGFAAPGVAALALAFAAPGVAALALAFAAPGVAALALAFVALGLAALALPSVALGLAALALPSVAHADPTALLWRHVTTPSRGEPPTAVALDASGSRVAIADAAGVSLALLGAEGPVRFERVARVPGAADLAFSADGGLWIAGANGLWLYSAHGRLREVPARPGVGAREARRVAAAGRFVAVATGSGLSISADGEHWAGVGGVLATTPIVDVSFAPDAAAGHAVLWALADNDVWRIELRVDAGEGRLAASARKLNAVAARPTSELAVDLWTGGAGQVGVVYPTAVAFLASPAAHTARSWRVVRPTLPPGALALRFSQASGRFWLLHDRGLSWSTSLDGPWRRAASPAGSAAGRDLGVGGGRVWLASADGLLAAETSPGPAPPSGPGPRWKTGDPAIEHVHRAVLRAQQLGPDRMAALHQRIRVRGWLPTLSLRFAVEDESDWSREDDQAFITGAKRFLEDHDRGGGRDYAGSATLSWDFGDAAFEPDTIDLAREERQWIGLRDDVLDEVNQLYFERQGLLQRLASAPPPAGDEQAEISRRASELAAGLDGWTGGWFSTASRAPVVPPPPQ